MAKGHKKKTHSDTMNMSFGDRLRFVRQFRELSQQQLGDKASLQTTAISHFETGTRTPHIVNLIRLVKALDISADYLLGIKPIDFKEQTNGKE